MHIHLVGSGGGDLAVIRTEELVMVTAVLNGINGFEINGNQPSGAPPEVVQPNQVNVDIDGGVGMGDVWNVLRTDWLTINGAPTIFLTPLSGTVAF